MTDGGESANNLDGSYLSMTKLCRRYSRNHQPILNLQELILGFSPGIFHYLIVLRKRLHSSVVPFEVLGARLVIWFFRRQIELRNVLQLLTDTGKMNAMTRVGRFSYHIIRSIYDRIFSIRASFD